MGGRVKQPVRLCVSSFVLFSSLHLVHRQASSERDQPLCRQRHLGLGYRSRTRTLKVTKYKTTPKTNTPPPRRLRRLDSRRLRRLDPRRLRRRDSRAFSARRSGSFSFTIRTLTIGVLWAKDARLWVGIFTPGKEVQSQFTICGDACPLSCVNAEA